MEHADGTIASPPHRINQCAFTLIELLVVIAVVGVIAAILFPVFAHVREQGRRQACISNERQLGLAMQQYIADNNELFAHAPLGTGGKWVTQTYPYVKDIALFRCPTDSTADASGASVTGGFPSSYGLNGNLGQAWVPGLAGLSSPSKTVMFFEVENGEAAVDNSPHLAEDGSSWGDGGTDGSAFGDSAGNLSTDSTFPSGSTKGLPRYATGNIGGRLLNGATKDGKVIDGNQGSTARHHNGANYVAVDGHAVWLQPQTVSGGSDALHDNCLQGTDNPQPADCAKHPEPRMAAGTAAGKYILTFSTK